MLCGQMYLPRHLRSATDWSFDDIDSRRQIATSEDVKR